MLPSRLRVVIQLVEADRWEGAGQERAEAVVAGDDGVGFLASTSCLPVVMPAHRKNPIAQKTPGATLVPVDAG